MRTPYLLSLVFLTILAGCGGSPGLYPVHGKITSANGPLPKGEVAIIRFEPIAGTTAEGQTKAASGDIQPDGTYQLTTLDRNDGAFVGDYKVTFTINKTYLGQESLIDPKFTRTATTPHTAKVTSDGDNQFDFEIAKAPGK
jgi:hypothetical protein